MKQLPYQLVSKQERQYMMDSVLNIIKNKSQEPNPVECMLLEWFVLGELTVEQLLDFLQAANQQQALDALQN
ncbi:hypothetical protein I2I05_16030 [Hymenobacter sp. BT683]|uniref:Uncharacterized protein n=1 Tax=Hymenobacter jeongseonensis TaxID=2791027 RepID=A0ABS0ILZ3_9BACT|nr:hypothetical protein [Hymenobacter jeongseonensis]MBF9238913.1 hypothetical protein [Hymenobacter jeongseonensis]